MKIRALLYAVVLIPVVGICVVSTLGVKNSLEELNSAKFAESTSHMTLPLGELIHLLQVERGMSAGFIASGGKDFANELPNHRKKVDQAAANYRDVLRSADFITRPELVQALNERLSGAKDMRERVSALSTTVPEMAGVYTAAVRGSINLTEYLLSHLDAGRMAQISAAWVSLIEAKEAAGLERAMGANGFGAGAFSESVLRRFAEYGAVQKVSIGIFDKFSGIADKGGKSLDLPENEALTTMRKAALAGDLGGTTGGEWFAASTAWIERLRGLERGIEQELTDIAAKKTQISNVQLAVYAGSAVLAVVLSMIGGWIVTRKLVVSFDKLSMSMQRIGKKDFKSKISANSKVKEMDGLALQLKTMRDDLSDADTKLQDAFAKSFAFEDSNMAMIVVGPDLTVLANNRASTKLIEENASALSIQMQDFDADSPLGTSLAGLTGDAGQMKNLFSDPAQLPWHSDVAIGDIKLELNVSYVSTEDGAYGGNIIQARDVTAERLHAGMIAAIDRDNGVVEIDLKGKILRTNKIFSDMLQKTNTELVATHVSAMFFDEDGTHDSIDRSWGALINGETLAGKFSLACGDGSKVWIRGTFTPVLDSNGDAFKISLISENITASVEAAARREKERETAANERNIVVDALALGLQSLADGDLAFRIEDHFADEYKSLRMDYNDAVQKLAVVIDRVIDGAQQVNANSTELNSASTNLATRTEKQAASLAQTAAALDEVTMTVQQTANKAKDADQAVKSAKTATEENEKTAESAMEVMNLIASSSNEISSITTLIDDISFQTNLLALNAGVEAARAGEAGQGFAVVASEVRGLAQRAAEAAAAISELIATSHQHVENGVELVENVRQSLARITNEISEASSNVLGIRNATTEQATTLDTINKSVGEIEYLTQQNAAMGEESSALSASLRNDADILTSTVSTFQKGSKPMDERASA